MVKKIIWSKEALIDQFEIISFWNENNYSEKYGNKLRGLFRATSKLIQKHPKIGIQTNIYGVKIRKVKEYYLVYKEVESSINILAIWDCRQDPVKFEAIKSR